jgi:hypothetical protein
LNWIDLVFNPPLVPFLGNERWMIVELAQQGKQVRGLTEANRLGTRLALNKTPVDSIATWARVHLQTSDALVDCFHHFAYHLAIPFRTNRWESGSYLTGVFASTTSKVQTWIRCSTKKPRLHGARQPWALCPKFKLRKCNDHLLSTLRNRPY